MGEVVDLGLTPDVTPEQALRVALAQGLTSVVVLGSKPSGNVYMAMSTAQAAEVNWLLDCGKALLMSDVKIVGEVDE
jgi:L-aminopeptidase/D-esterase-like protein